MRFEDSPISKSINYRKGTLSFCDYYAADKFIIVEVNQGVHFDEEKLETLIEEFIDIYPPTQQLAYITNRINNYSSDPILWNYLDNDIPVVGAAIVTYRDSTLLSANIEKHISKISVKRAYTIEEAIGWALRLKELQC
ncbi:hypothetical protein [Winogradskyella jejuensis]|uniref:SpoIIAA-like n=1 Tax=Winogradskyella jejuensis TaxID=1089305 RepID=A0A1M5TJB4_9FLAO|nr:hypothetical protein [Winogradskyella jejuensis]SHH50794.1 hypothetical protein SAMN05444148_2186 [Winogradskyella jejuensis]